MNLSQTFGFVLHFLALPTAALCLSWLFIPEAILNYWQVTYYPPKDWSVLIPCACLCLFVSIPLLYAACNILATPPIYSPVTLWDDHTDLAPTSVPLNFQLMSCVPEICDLDVAQINRCVYNACIRGQCA